MIEKLYLEYAIFLMCMHNVVIFEIFLYFLKFYEKNCDLFHNKYKKLILIPNPEKGQYFDDLFKYFWINFD